MRSRLLALALGLLGLAACATRIEYAPNPGAFGREQAKSKIVEVIKALPQAGVEVEVTDSYFKVSWVGGGYWGPFWYGPGGPTARTVHFDSIASHKFTEKKGRYRVELFDASNRRLFLLQTRQEGEARVFLDAVYAMRQGAAARG